MAVHTEALQNFRSVDYHFVTPGPALAQTSGASSCRVFVLAVGFAQPAAPEPSPITAP